MLDKDSTFNEFMKEHYEKFSQPGYKRFATNVARAMYLLKVNQKKSEKKEEDEKDEKIELKEGSREINRYKRILVSDKRKQKRQENQNQKKQDREQEAARLNRKL